MKILIIFVNDNLSGRNKNKEDFLESVNCIKKHISDVNKENTIEIASLYSEETEENDQNMLIIENTLKQKIKYRYVCKLKQFSKMMYFLNELNERYDWYIKTRCDLQILEPLNTIKLNSFKKDCRNARVRSYIGPKLDKKIEYGCSIGGNRHMKRLKKTSLLYNENKKKIMLDDMIYFFHDNVRDKLFKFQQLEDKREDEGFHSYYWKTVNKVELNIISLYVCFKKEIFSSKFSI